MTSAPFHITSTGERSFTRKLIVPLLFIAMLLTAPACQKNPQAGDSHAGHHHQSASEKAACETQPASRAAAIMNSQPTAVHIVKGSGETAGMVWIPAGEYLMGASARPIGKR